MPAIKLPVISHEEFEKLYQNEAGATALPVFTIHLVEAEEIFENDWNISKKRGIRAMFLNVATPSLYTNKKGDPHVIFPVTQTLTYQMVEGVFPSDRPPFMYFMRHSVTQDMENWHLMFENEDGALTPEFNLEDVLTH